MTTTQYIVPSVWLNGTADEAATFYTDVFENATIVDRSTYPTEGLPDFQQDYAGKTLTFDLSIDGYRINFINAGGPFSPTPAISFILNFDPSVFPDAEDRLNRLWEMLVDGGKVLMPLGHYPFMERYGWLADRFGVCWQLALTNPDGAPRPFVTPQFLFVGEQPQAEAAINKYIELFDGTRGVTNQNPEVPGALMYTDFQLAGQWFAATDGGPDHEFSFNEAISLQAFADDQAEIDRLWEALSAAPESEQCGWCKDEFGVSWQIVPTQIGELLQIPGAYQRMMEMKKMDIDGLRGI